MIVIVILTCACVIGRSAHSHISIIACVFMGVVEGEVMNGATTDALNSSGSLVLLIYNLNVLEPA